MNELMICKRGEERGIFEASQHIQEAIENDQKYLQLLLEKSIEPSDDELNMLPAATCKYIENLKEIADYVLPHKFRPKKKFDESTNESTFIITQTDNTKTIQ